MTKKVLFIIFNLTLSIYSLYSQQGGGPNQMPANGIISGTVVDATGTPVEYATITLISLRDSSIVTGGISDAKGKFKLSELKLGAYKAVIKLLGFESKEINPIYLFPKGKGQGQGIEQDFGTVELDNSSIAIDAVTVTGEKSNVQYKIDKKVINVAQDINATSGTAVDILQNIPSVSVDIEGNVQLRGSGSFTVLIDGKPTALQGSEALQSIPSTMIENIEIITNPSAKFDPNGAAGIINIILKKKKTLGLNGIANASVGTGDKYSGNFSLNYKVGKLNFTGGFEYRDETRRGSGISKREIYSVDTTFSMNSNGSRNMKNKGFGITAGVDYYINDKNTISFNGRYGNREFKMMSSTFYDEFTSPLSFNDYYIRSNDMGFGGFVGNSNLDFEHKFKKPDQKLNISFNYSTRDGSRLNNQYKYITDQFGVINDDNPELRKEDEIGPSKDYRYKLDYVSPLGTNGMLEAGYQGRNEIENEDLVYSNYNSISGLWEIDPVRSNKIDFNQTTQAVYGTFASKIIGFDYKIGLRSEYYTRVLNQVTIGDEYTMSKLDFFPSAYITRQLTKTKQIQLNYSRRINRPGGRQLDPFPDYSDPKNIRAGNPYLDAEYIDSYELNFQNQFNQSFISVETYYRRTNNLMTDVTYQLGGDTLYRTMDNLNHDNSIGFELNSNLVLNKWWRLNASGTVYYYQMIGKIEGEDISNESVNWNLRLNNTFSFKTKTKIQITGFYNGPSVTAQGTRDGFFFSNLSVRQDFLNDKLSLTATLQDVFGTSSFSNTQTTSGFYTYNKFSREPHVVTLALTYRINNFKQKRSGDRNGEEDMNMEMQ